MNALRDLVTEVGATPHPTARVLHPSSANPRRAAVLPGAFNPPTLAHVALAAAARERGSDVVAFALATRTIDKEAAAGLTLEERLALLRSIAEQQQGLGVLVQNRGLYADQAIAIRHAWPALDELSFVVGMDKVAQIFDPRYYDDFARALDRLFAEARLLVAARGALDRAALERLLTTAPARRHANRIEWIELDPAWLAMSSTAVRRRLASGEVPDEWLPSPVARYLREHPDRFIERR